MIADLKLDEVYDGFFFSPSRAGIRPTCKVTGVRSRELCDVRETRATTARAGLETDRVAGLDAEDGAVDVGLRERNDVIVGLGVSGGSEAGEEGGRECDECGGQPTGGDS